MNTLDIDLCGTILYSGIMKVIQRLKPKQKGAYQKKLKKVDLDVKICPIPLLVGIA